MIRDPSDGTIKPPPKPALSGLPLVDRKDQDELDRLQRSRAWLRDYMAWLRQELPGQVE